jgi:hypothetical protein
MAAQKLFPCRLPTPPSKSAVYRLVSGELTTSARIKLTTSKTPIATWHGTASVGSSPPPQAHKSFPGYARGRSHPRGAAARHETSLGADIAESGPDGWSTFREQGWVISRERRSARESLQSCCGQFRAPDWTTLPGCADSPNPGSFRLIVRPGLRVRRPSAVVRVRASHCRRASGR